MTSATPIAVACTTVDAGHVAEALQRRHLLGVEDHQRRASRAPLLERLGGLLGGRLVEARAVEHGDAAAGGVHRQRRPQGAPARLAVHLHGVVRAASGRRRRRRRGGAGRSARPPGRARCPSGARPWRWSSRPRRGRAWTPCRGAGPPGRRAPSRATSDSWNSSPNTAAGRSALDCLPSTGALRGGGGGHQSAPHLHGAVAWAGHGALDQQQVALRVHLDDLEASLGDALAAHPARASACP